MSTRGLSGWGAVDTSLVITKPFHFRTQDVLLWTIRSQDGRWRRDLCRKWVWHNLPRDDITASCGEVNDLIGRLLGEASPAVHLAHRDLARSRQSPEQHRGSFRGRQDGLGLDPSLELF